MLVKENIQQIYPLSPMQETLFFHTLYSPESPVYFEQVRFMLKGVVNVQEFQRTIITLTQRHDILRTLFILKSFERPIQVVLKEWETNFSYRDISTNSRHMENVLSFIEKDKTNVFDLSKAVPLRITLFKVSEGNYELIWSFHHILMDGWCLGILHSEFMEIYHAYIDGKPIQLPAPKPYIELIKWLEAQNTKKSNEYWKEYLREFNEASSLLPPFISTDESNNYKNEEIKVTIGKSKSALLLKTSRKNGVTLHALLQTIWAVLVAKYSDKKDVVFGSVVSGRSANLEGIESMVGLFINTIPVRYKLNAETSFVQLLLNYYHDSLKSHSHHYGILADIMAFTPLKNNLFDHLFIFENYPLRNSTKRECDMPRDFEIVGGETYDQTSYNLNILVFPGDEVTLKFKYNGLIYSHQFIEQLSNHFQHLVDVILNNIDICISDISVLKKNELKQITRTFNNTAALFPKEISIKELFEKQSESTPNEIALVYDDLNISYSELNIRANKFADYLNTTCQPESGKRAVVMLSRSEKNVIVLLALVKAGMCYVPISHDAPKAMLDVILKDVDGDILITERNVVVTWKKKIIVFEDLNLDDYRIENPVLPIDQNRGFYIIYTSGSSGIPKGLTQKNKTLTNLIQWQLKYSGIEKGLRMLQYSAFTFDVSLQDVFFSLSSGGCLYILPDRLKLDILGIWEYIAQYDIQLLSLPTTVLHNLFRLENDIPIDAGSIKHVVTAGEQLMLNKTLRSFLTNYSKVKLHNHYGPAETHVVTSFTFSGKEVNMLSHVPIGKPVSNTKIYILDESFFPVPKFVPGEIYIGGAQLANGYLNQEKLTNSKFLSSLLPRWEEGMLYRTGDIGRWLEDGNVQFLKRKDNQIKIRGNRIELEEIEHHLIKDINVENVAVIAKKDKDGDNYLVAFIVSSGNPDVYRIKEGLKNKLPSYMIPNVFVSLPSIPVTSHGKADRKLLSEISIERPDSSFVPPVGKVEEKLADIWSAVLNQVRVGRFDDFFEIGGHSLKAARLLALIRKELKVKIKLKDVFNFPTLKDLAKLIGEESKLDFKPIPAVEEQEFYNLSHAQKRLWVIQQAEGGESAYNMSVRYSIKGDLQVDLLENAIKSVIARHEILRTVFATVGGQPKQKVLSRNSVTFNILYLDLRNDPAKDSCVKNESIMESGTPFNLESEILVRARLFRMENQRYILLLTLHHIIFDGWSITIFFNEIASLYNSSLTNEPCHLKTPGIHYKDYTLWHNKLLKGGAFQLHKKYWIHRLQGQLPPLSLPIDFARPTSLTFKGTNVNFYIGTELTTKLKSFAKTRNVSLFMVLLSSIKGWLYLLTSQEDITIGCPVAGRDHSDLDDQLGFYSNTIPVRSIFKGSDSFDELLQKISCNTLADFEHQHYPFDLLSEELANKRDRSRGPFFDILFVLQNNEQFFKGLDGLEISYLSSGGGASIYDLLIGMEEYHNGIKANISFNTALFVERTINNLIANFLLILEGFIDNPKLPLKNGGDYLPTYKAEEIGIHVLDLCKYDTPSNIFGHLYIDELTIVGGKESFEKFHRINYNNNFLIETGEKARRRLNGEIEVLNFVPLGFPHDGKYYPTSYIEISILKSSLIDEVKVVNSQIYNGSGSPLAYLVYNDFPEENILKKELLEYLPAGFIDRIVFISISSLPLNVNGFLDYNALAAVNQICQHDCTVMEDIVKSIEGVKEVAIIVKDKMLESYPRIHLWDVFPKFSNNSFESCIRDFQKNIRTSKEFDKNHERKLAWSKGDSLCLDKKLPNTLKEAIISSARNYPEKGIEYVDKKDVSVFISYPELLHEAQCLLQGLHANGLSQGDKVILNINSIPDYFKVLWACVLGGIIPSTVAVYFGSGRESGARQKLYNSWLLLGKPHILTDVPPNNSEFEKDGLGIINIDKLEGFEPCNVLYDSSPDDVALFQFTSGSTGIPKCIPQTHKNLTLQFIGSKQLNGYTSNDVTLNWLPFDHVVPLVTFHIKDVFWGIHQIHIATSKILSNPISWLDYLEKYKITHSWSPNFGYKLVSDQIISMPHRRWNLKKLKFLMNAGEQVTYQVIKDFLHLTSDFGISPDVMQPAFGMAEVCTCMTYNNSCNVESVYRFKKSSLEKLELAKENEFFISYVDLGTPIPGVEIRITNQNNQLLSEGQIGRLQIKSPSITPGYYMNPGANEESFINDGWFNSGDLGFILNGRLFVTGREKEIIIIRGVNYPCYEIEDIVSQLQGIISAHVAACSVYNTNDATECLIIFFSPEKEVSSELIFYIRNSLVQSIGLNPEYIIPIPKIDFPKTSSGKIQRTLLRKKFVLGHFKEEIKKIDLILENKSKTLPSWFFKQVWKPKEIVPPASYTPRNILIFTGNENSSLRNVLEKSGWIKIEYGVEFKQISKTHFTICPEEFEHYKYVLNDLQRQKLLPELIIHSWTYHENSKKQDYVNVESIQKKGIFSLLHLFKTWDQMQLGNLDLVVLTSNAHQIIEQEEIMRGNGSFRGFLKSASQEIPWLKWKLIDVSNENNLEVILAKELSVTIIKEEEIAYRNNKRFVPKLKNVELLDRKFSEVDMPLEREGFYLITGGLGGIGAKISKYLIDFFDASLLIIGKTDIQEFPEKNNSSPLSSKQSAKTEKLKKLQAGAKQVVYRAVDVCDLRRMSKLVDEMEDLWKKPLNGVIHLAGEMEDMTTHWNQLSDHLILNVEESMFKNAIYSKVLGAEALYQMIKDKPDVLFVSFSSVNSYFGGYSFGAYSAASSLLDQVMLYISSKRKHVYCLNWSIWNNLGMNKNSGFNDLLEKKGFLGIEAKEGIHSFITGLALNHSQLFIGLNEKARFIGNHIVEDLPKPKFIELYYCRGEYKYVEEKISAEVSKYSLNVPVTLHEVDNFIRDEQGNIDKKQLYKKPFKSDKYLKPEKESEIILSNIWEEILNIDNIGVNDNFFGLGGDSLKAIKVMSRIYEEFGVSLGIHNLFVHPSIKQLAKSLSSIKAEIHDEIKNNINGSTNLASRAQERLWFLSRIEEVQAAYNVFLSFRINGKLEIGILNQALEMIILRHESLRTTFQMEDGKLHQFIHSRAPNFALKFTDISTSLMKEKLASKIVNDERVIPFDMANGPLIKAHLIGLGYNQHIFAITLHHIIWDVWSEDILIRELFILYQAIIERKSPALPPLKMQYRDFVAMQMRELNEEEMNRNRKYWLKKLKNLSSLDIPTDFPRPPVKTFAGSRMPFKLNKTQTKFAKELAIKKNTSMFVIMLASAKALLYRYTMQEDIVIGTPISGRNRVELENQIGLYLNTLVLRTQVDNDETFLDLIDKVNKNAIEAFQHQSYPFDILVDELNIERDLSRSPVFDVMVTLLQSTGEKELVTSSGLSFEVFKADFSYSKFDLTFLFKEVEGEIQGIVEYNTDLFTNRRMERLISHFQGIWDAIILNSSLPLKLLDYISHREKELLIQKFNAANALYPPFININTLLENQVSKSPNAIALIFDSVIYTYQELNEKVRRLANFLKINFCLDNSDTAAVLLNRSEWSVICMLAILRRGACYLSVDPAFPDSRIDLILNDVKPKVIFIEEPLPYENFDREGIIYLDEIDLSVVSQEIEIPEVAPNDHSYIIYTSGSTGVPKGIVQTYRTLYNLIQWDICESGLGKNQIVLQHSSFSFDSSLHDTLYALCSGGTLHVIKERLKLRLEELKDYIIEKSITVLSLPFSALSNLMDTFASQDFKNHCLKHIISTGEQLLINHNLEAFLKDNPNIVLHNFYGPSETHVVTAYSISANQKEIIKRVPIGKPISNSSIYILDEKKKLVPIGIPGEIHIGGANLALKYLNNEEATNKKFITNGITGEDPLYCSGDIGYWKEDGNIVYLGRKDNQIKILGYRIELGEIEHFLIKHPNIDKALVLAKEDKSGMNHVVAYLIVNKQITIRSIKIYLEKCLPPYMIPMFFVIVEKFEITAIGKVNYNALPDPFQIAKKQTFEFVTASSKIEKDISAIWKRLLDREEVGIYDNFFDIGGNSLKLISLYNELSSKFPGKVTLADLFKYPSISSFISHIDDQEENMIESINV